jgi:hypothetical protein
MEITKKIEGVYSIIVMVSLRYFRRNRGARGTEAGSSAIPSN